MADAAQSDRSLQGFPQPGMHSVTARCLKNFVSRASQADFRVTSWGFYFETQLHLLYCAFACVSGAARPGVGHAS